MFIILKCKKFKRLPTEDFKKRYYSAEFGKNFLKLVLRELFFTGNSLVLKFETYSILTICDGKS
jgi:hypothetical protein